MPEKKRATGEKRPRPATRTAATGSIPPPSGQSVLFEVTEVIESEGAATWRRWGVFLHAEYAPGGVETLRVVRESLATSGYVNYEDDAIQLGEGDTPDEAIAEALAYLDEWRARVRYLTPEVRKGE